MTREFTLSSTSTPRNEAAAPCRAPRKQCQRRHRQRQTEVQPAPQQRNGRMLPSEFASAVTREFTHPATYAPPPRAPTPPPAPSQSHCRTKPMTAWSVVSKQRARKRRQRPQAATSAARREWAPLVIQTNNDYPRKMDHQKKTQPHIQYRKGSQTKDPEGESASAKTSEL